MEQILQTKPLDKYSENIPPYYKEYLSQGIDLDDLIFGAEEWLPSER